MKQKTELEIPENIVPRIQECRSEYFDTSDSGTVFFVGVAADEDGAVVLYSWTISDGFRTNEQSFVHTFQHPGAYQATLTVTDDKGAINSTSIMVYVYETAYNNEQYDRMRIIGRWKNTQGTIIEFTSDGTYTSSQYLINDSYWLSNDWLFIRSTINNNTIQYEYSFEGENSLTFYRTGQLATSRDTWVRINY